MPLPNNKAVKKFLDLIQPWRGLAMLFLSLWLCMLLMPLRLPGLAIGDIAPNWLLIWLVSFSLSRPVLVAIIMGMAIGLVHDALTIPQELTASVPSHVWGMMLISGLTALLQKQRYLQEDFISVALIVFGMTVLAETAIAMQWSFLSFTGKYNLEQIWTQQQRIALVWALLSGLWAPVLHFPLTRLRIPQLDNRP
jgi:rod shape-determining protein MreD